MSGTSQRTSRTYVWGWTIAVTALCGVLLWKMVG